MRKLLLALAPLALAVNVLGATALPSRNASAADMMPPGKTGDVNMDGRANSLDALDVLSVNSALIAEPPEPWHTAADVNCDEVVDSVDATVILQADAGLIQLRP